LDSFDFRCLVLLFIAYSAMPAMVDENTSPNSAPDMFFVPQKAFNAVSKILKANGTIGEKDVDALVNWEPVKTEKYLPLDMRGAGENLDDFEAALAKFGAQKCAECFVKAHSYYQNLKKSLPEDDRINTLTAKEWKDKYGEDDDDEEEDAPKPLYIPDMFYVPKQAFEDMKAKLLKGTIADADVDALVNFEAKDGETYLPLDMNGAEEDLDEFEEALKKFGAKKIGQCFIQAMEKFDKFKNRLAEKDQKPLTAKQWKDKHQEDDEEEDGEAEEEEDDDDDEDEDGDDEDGDEPPSKKAKSE